jgi:hypothetical protein
MTSPLLSSSTHFDNSTRSDYQRLQIHGRSDLPPVEDILPESAVNSAWNHVVFTFDQRYFLSINCLVFVLMDS